MENRLIDLQRSRSFSDALSAVFDAFIGSMRPLFKATLWIVGPWIIIGSLAYGFGYGDLMMFSLMEVSENPFASFGDELGTAAITLSVAAIALIVASILLNLVVYQYFDFTQTHKEVPTIELLRESMRGKAWIVVQTTLLTGLLFGTVMMAIFVPLVAVGGVASAVFSMMLVFLCMLYFMVPMSLIIVTRLREPELAYFASVKRVFALVRSYWWWTFGIIGIIYLAYSMAVTVFQIPTYAIMILSMVANVDGSTPLWLTTLSAVALAVGQIAGQFLMVLPLTALTVLYYNHAERLDAVTLEERIGSIGGRLNDEG